VRVSDLPRDVEGFLATGFAVDNMLANARCVTGSATGAYRTLA